jgi:hypothetical protein
MLEKIHLEIETTDYYSVCSTSHTLLSLLGCMHRTLAVECCYQNVGIATSLALTMFQGDDLSNAMGVPFFYGLCEAVFGGIYCIVCWKAGWSKAPPETPIWTVLFTSFEVLDAETQEIDENKTSRTEHFSDGSKRSKALEMADEDIMTTSFSIVDSGGTPTEPGSLHPKKAPAGQRSTTTTSSKLIDEEPGSLA